MAYKFFAFGLSGILIIVGILNITKGKGLTSGVDFAGGTLIRLIFRHPVPITELRQSLSDIGLGNSKIQEVGKGRREYLIRTIQATGEEIEEEQGIKNLNSIDRGELTLLLEVSFPENASEIAQKIIS
ncbi:MAG: protein translocase subunit SecF, partial [Candidatus Aminicenantaceae bacterium]